MRHDPLGPAGLRYRWAEEILARSNYPDDQLVQVSMSAFMASESHRVQILDDVYDRVAVGEARTPQGVNYFTVIFASER